MPKPHKVLFVEDSGFFRKGVAQSLTHEGFEVVTAATGEEALDLASREQPDIILLDMMLPRLDGMMVLRVLRAKAETQNIPVIVLSGSAMERDQAEAYKLGISRYFRKDNSPMSELVAAIRGALDVVV
jgi:CheY-like chemotaxis protein